MKDDNSTRTTIVMMILVFALFVGILIFVGKTMNCDTPFWYSDDMYKYKHYNSNHSGSWYTCKTGSHSADAQRQADKEEARRLAAEQQTERKVCYEAGQFEEYHFDLIEDYDFSCEKIKYINDHFVDKAVEKDGGSIKHVTSRNGFFSSSRSSVEIKLKNWVVLQSLPTDVLLKDISYHSDCNNETKYWKKQTVCSDGKIFPDETNYCTNGKTKLRDTTEAEFYTESDFVMYYVNNCIED
jgi:hypothetical protein